ncbi:hypothetical protein NPIL_658581 [Nephila pilipes]|uniref:Uncharacterized protein n=1 Tax=Nephila pilipes TaxID=299642 RepID=A0A8X6P0N2_NEPPI|nr:hypothetical protein NPIL_658581 [Nephila pilipes]
MNITSPTYCGEEKKFTVLWQCGPPFQKMDVPENDTLCCEAITVSWHLGSIILQQKKKEKRMHASFWLDPKQKPGQTRSSADVSISDRLQMQQMQLLIKIAHDQLHPDE